MKVYGYCRISTSKQSLERQIRNIKLAYPDAVIVKETYTGTKIQGRKEFEKLIKLVSAGDTICNSCHFPSFRAKPIEKQMDFYIMILTNEGKNQTGKVFWRNAKNNTVHCASGTSGSSRAECCGASPFPASVVTVQ